ncbi:HEAT repeat domain-containing protein [Microbispora siamensis]|uniref:HEAT repeat domain-containing protein n=1 Tax=Microbispora siamensis TaxID=564413 RepID=UPI00194F1221|nr:HEAT repeat domain-containing protein [Microbispora siamensis]
MVETVETLIARAAPGHLYVLWDLWTALLRAAADREHAERALDALAAAPPWLWSELDPARRATWYEAPTVATAPEPRGLWRLRRKPPMPDTSLAVLAAACVHDGHERERAVRHPAMRHDPRLLPILVIRAADWVPEVRSAAADVLEQALATPTVTVLETVAPVAVRLGGRRRGEAVVRMVRDAITRACGEVLTALRSSADIPTRRFAYRACLDGGRLGEADLVHAAQHEEDVTCRTLCAEAVAGLDRPELLRVLLANRAAQVRATALTALVRLGAPEHGERMLGDGSSVVRLTAQWAVRRAGGDPAEFYRRLLNERPGHGLRHLVAGLGECGTPADAPTVLPYLAGENPRVRAEAVRAASRLGAQVDLAAMLVDPAPIVVRRAAEALRTAPPPEDRLWPLFDSGRPPHVRRAAYRLLAGTHVWNRLKADLILLAGPDESLRERARADVRNWLDRQAATAYVGPPEPLRRELAVLIERAYDVLGERTVRILKWHLRADQQDR